MNHRLHNELQGRLYDALAPDYQLLESQAQTLATTAITTVFDDLIACAEFRQKSNERLRNAAEAERWAMERAWLANRKEEVLS